MEIFFAFLDELAHSKQFLKSRENDLLLTPPPFQGKFPKIRDFFYWMPSLTVVQPGVVSCRVAVQVTRYVPACSPSVFTPQKVKLVGSNDLSYWIEAETKLSWDRIQQISQNSSTEKLYKM